MQKTRDLVPRPDGVHALVFLLHPHRLPASLGAGDNFAGANQCGLKAPTGETESTGEPWKELCVQTRTNITVDITALMDFL
jgi:hypothetical protein